MSGQDKRKLRFFIWTIVVSFILSGITHAIVVAYPATPLHIHGVTAPTWVIALSWISLVCISITILATVIGAGYSIVAWIMKKSNGRLYS